MPISIYEIEIDTVDCKVIAEDGDFLLEPSCSVQRRLTVADFVAAVANASH